MLSECIEAIALKQTFIKFIRTTGCGVSRGLITLALLVALLVVVNLCDAFATVP
jgi:hypothetical protein